MRVILFELRKIFDWKRIGILLVLNLLLLNSFLPVFSVDESQVASRRELIENHGFTVDQADIDTFTEVIRESIGGFDFDAFLQDRYWLADFNLESEEDFFNYGFLDWLIWDSEIPLSDEQREKGMIASAWIGARRYAAHIAENAPNWEWFPDRQAERIIEVAARYEHSIFPAQLLRPYQETVANLGILTTINLMILITPLWLMERRAQMLDIQYSTKLGRRIFARKLMATLITTTIALLVPVAITFIFLMPNLSTFLPMVIDSFVATLWYDVTFLQYLLLSIGLIYLHSILISMMSFLLSKISINYLLISAIQIAIIFIGYATFWFVDILADPISIIFDSSMRHNPQFLVPTFYSVFTVVIVLLLTICWFKEKKRDVVV